jgi:hypothetical protein
MGKPKDPVALGRGPRPGYSNPRFGRTPTTDVSAPAGGYQSIIDTSPTETGRVKKITNVQSPVSGLRGSGAGDKSLNAFSRGLTDTSRNAIDRAYDKFEKQKQKQSEKSLSEDYLGQRQNAFDLYRQEVFKDIFDQDTSTRYSQSIADLNQYYETERKNEKTKRAANMIKKLSSMLV